MKQRRSPALGKAFRNIPFIAAFAAFVVIGISQPTSAAPVVGFQAGRIIDDTIFTDKASMSQAQIQQFLQSKVPVCDTNGTKTSEFGGGTRAQWAAARGYAPPFTCLKDFSEGGKSAAQIIYETAQEFSINPQVLLVLLEKEQGLITDDWPIPGSSQYRTATGYGCPDTAACDSQYFGLTNQLRWSGRMFRSIMNASPTWFTPYVLGNNYIQYNPNASCGGTTVNIENRATQALYNYTPYQPNPAAIAAGWGQVTCGAYGNRNFYLYFVNWFGSTTTTLSNVYIQDGVYKIKNASSGRFIDVANASTATGASVWLYDGNTTAAQNWNITRDSEGFYKIRNMASNKFVDVRGGSNVAGTKVWQWDGNDGCAQKWAATEVGNDFTFVNKCSGLALDLSGGSTANTSLLQAWNRNGTAAQIWSLVSLDTQPVPNGTYKIASSGGLAIDTEGQSTTAGSGIEIRTQNASATQEWKLLRATNGYYSIQNKASGGYLDAVELAGEPGAQLETLNSQVSCTQKWIVTPATGSSFTLRSACAGLVADVRGGLVGTSTTPVQVFTSNNTSAQHWTLSEVTPVPNGTYAITSTSGKRLDLRSGSLSSGTSVQIWDSNGTGAQSWQLTKQTDGFYSIVSTASGRHLDIRGGGVSPGTQVQIWDGNTTCAQRWSVSYNSDSSVSIASSCSSLMLDILGGAVLNRGTPVQTFEANNTAAQKWLLESL